MCFYLSRDDDFYRLINRRYRAGRDIGETNVNVVGSVNLAINNTESGRKIRDDNARRADVADDCAH